MEECFVKKMRMYVIIDVFSTCLLKHVCFYIFNNKKFGFVFCKEMFLVFFIDTNLIASLRLLNN